MIVLTSVQEMPPTNPHLLVFSLLWCPLPPCTRLVCVSHRICHKRLYTTSRLMLKWILWYQSFVTTYGSLALELFL